jgi:predicted DNA-binding transcriptional regulator AlpA
MPRKIEEPERAKPPLKPARDLDGCDRVLTPKEAADLLRVSTSWLAKGRMRGDGPPFVPLGGSVRYLESTLMRWMKSHQRLLTSERKARTPAGE